MDFMTDDFFDGRRIRMLTMVDHITCESLAIKAGERLTDRDVVSVLGRIGMDRPLPKTIRLDNGPEFISKVLDQ